MSTKPVVDASPGGTREPHAGALAHPRGLGQDREPMAGGLAHREVLEAMRRIRALVDGMGRHWGRA